MIQEKIPSKIELDSKLKEKIDFSLDTPNGILAGTINVWVPLVNYLRIGNLNPIDKLPHYEDYVAKVWPQLSAVEYILKNSNSESVKKFDELVDDFNSKPKEMKKNNDYKTARDFYNKADKLIRGECGVQI